MNDLKVHINVSAGTNGIVFQKKVNTKYISVSWNDLTMQEQQRLSKLFQDMALIHSSDPNVVKKECTKCHRVLPLDMFYKRINKQGVNMGTAVCKQCKIADADKRNKIIRENRTEEEIEADREYQRIYREIHRTTSKPKKKKKVEDKQCKNCIRYKNCFTDKYKNESNFANTCKRYDDGNEDNKL